MTEIPRQDPL